MVQQSTRPSSTLEDPEWLGVPAALTQAALQTDAFKELVNKLSWALGSTYRTPYSGVRHPTRRLAIKMASYLVQSQGYPSKIAIDPVK